jgi:uncharacterized MAPEG superfamily protein
MSTDLAMLVATAVLCLLMPLTYLIGRMQTPGGMEWGVGNRDRSFEVPPWAARAQRAHNNLVENIAPFAILVLVAQVTGKADALTAAGAVIFFCARVLHAAVYIAGIVYVRTAVFFVGMAGELLILLQLFR